jgi:hypothetical protein
LDIMFDICSGSDDSAAIFWLEITPRPIAFLAM